MKTFSEFLNNFLTIYLVNQRNCSSNTINSYKTTFKLLIKYLINEKNIDIKNINFDIFIRDNIIDFLNYVETDLKCSIQTRNQRLAAIKSFCNYVLTFDLDNLSSLQKILSIVAKKCSQKEIAFLTKEELTLYLNSIETNSRKGIRDYTLIALMYDCAARESEIINVKLEDLKLDDNPSIKLYGKGRKTRFVPITTDTKILLENYIKLFKINRYDYLFGGNKKEKASSKMISHIVKKYNDKSGINKNIHPHVFRHTRAMHLLEAGINLVDIRDILGHSSVTTTEIYAKTSIELKRKAFQDVYDIDSNNSSAVWKDDESILKDLFEL